MQHSDEMQALAQVAERLRGRFQDVPAATVDEVVVRFHKEFDGRPIRDFVPVLVEREAADHIQALRPGVPRRPPAQPASSVGQFSRPAQPASSAG